MSRSAGFARALTLAALVLASGCAPQPRVAETTTPALRLPIESYRLPNGLRVVLVRDESVPTATVGVYYHIGFRSEPVGRTGFAHLFEHLMFEETANLAKGEAARLVNGNGGLSNGQTHFDYTNYFEVVPSHALRLVLWAEADRMRGLALSPESFANQKDVVKSEVRVNVLNRPYGGFGWIDLPQYANRNWHNAHNFYGDFADLDAATLADVRAFYDTYYVPANAALVVAGDFEPATIRAWIDEYFGPLPLRVPPARDDVSEPPQTEQRRAERVDPLAPRPGLALAYHLPPRNTRDWYAFGLLDEVLLQGEDSRLWQRLVIEKGYTDGIEGGMNFGGNMFDYEGPALWTLLMLHDRQTSDTVILRAIDATIADLDAKPIGRAELERARTKIRSAFYDLAGSSTRFGLTDVLGCFALFDDDPTRINRVDAEFRNVTAADLARVAHEYLRPAQRTVLSLQPGGDGGKTP
jgi:zinc protease